MNSQDWNYMASYCYMLNLSKPHKYCLTSWVKREFESSLLGDSVLQSLLRYWSDFSQLSQGELGLGWQWMAWVPVPDPLSMVPSGFQNHGSWLTLAEETKLDLVLEVTLWKSCHFLAQKWVTRMFSFIGGEEETDFTLSQGRLTKKCVDVF